MLLFKHGFSQINNTIPKKISEYDQAILISKQKKDYKALAKNHELKANLIQDKSIKAGIEYLKKALRLQEKLTDTVAIIRLNDEISTSYSQINEPENALIYLYNLLSIYEKKNDKWNCAKTHSQIGSLYDDCSDFKKAFEHESKALKMARALDSKKGQAALLNNITSLYDKMGQTEIALNCVREAISINKKMKNEEWLFINYMCLSDLYSRHSNYDSCQYYLFKTKAYVFSKGNSLDSIDLFRKLGIYYYRTGHFNEALSNFNQGILVSRRIENLKSEATFVHWLSEMYENYGEMELAISYLQLHHQLLDSLQKQRNTEVIEALNIRYNVKGLEDSLYNVTLESTLIKKEVSRKNTQLFTIILILFLLVLFAVFVVFQLKLQARKNKNLLMLNIESNDLTKMKYAQSNLSNDSKNAILEKFDSLIDGEELFRKQDLTINYVADKLEISRTYLSQVINEMYAENFTNYINKRRISLSKKFLSDPEYNKYSINGIAEMVGFKSLSSFNSAFKRNSGLTPSYFRKNSQLITK